MDKTTELKSIPISLILDEDRIRRDYGTKEEWDAFKSDIDEHGLYSAISITPITHSEFKYKLLAGGRRLKACSELQYEEINATVFTGEIDPLDMGIIELNENIKRKNLSIEEEATSKLKLLTLMQSKYGEKRSNRDRHGVSLNDVAKMIGESPANFSRDVQLAQAMAVIPNLKEAKTKSEAFNALKKGVKSFKEDKRVEVIKAEQKSRKDETEQDVIANWYKVGDVLDSMTGIKKVASGVVDYIEIDPPYAVRLKSQKKVNTIAGKNTEDYNEIDEKDYESFMRELLKEAYRIATPASWMILWFGPEPWFEPMFKWATEAGWIGNRLAGIWNKMTPGQTMQPSLYLPNSYEMFFYFRKSESSYIYNPGRSNVFDFKPVSSNNKVHPTERPIELMQEIQRTFVGKARLVCSPLAGSGNTLLAAVNLESKAFGWDLTESYKNSFILKVHNQKPGSYKSYL